MARAIEAGARLRALLDESLEGEPAEVQRALLPALLNEVLGAGERVVLVGGGAVEFYTRGAYITADIDLLGDRRVLLPLFEAAGFERRARHFVDPRFGLAVEVPGSRADATQTVLEVAFRGRTLYVLSPEDVIIDRLCAAKFWRSPTDWEQAVLVARAQRDQLDRARLRARAEEEGVVDFLDKLEGVVDADADG